jgi:hypothetical protein
MEKTQVEVDRIAAENPGQNRLSGLKQGRIWDGANLESYNGPVRLDLGQSNAIGAILRRHCPTGSGSTWAKTNTLEQRVG